MCKIRTFRLFVFLQCLAAAALYAQPAVQLWYQKAGNNIGPVMNVAVDPEGRIFASTYYQGIFRSADTGKTWQQVAPYTDGVWTMAVRTSGEIVASLWSRGIFRSTDHGSTWTPFVDSKLNSDIRAVNASGNIFIESAGKLFRSSPGDTSWIELPVRGGAVAVSGSTMIAAKGTSCYRSTDNGIFWTSIIDDLPVSIYALAADSAGGVYAGGFYDDTNPTPSIFSYDSVSESWQGSGPPSTVNAIIRRGDGTLFVATHDSGFYFSMDHGAEWKQCNIGLSSPKIYSLALLNDSTIVAGTVDGIFFISGPLSKLLPVELTSFTASVSENTVIVQWKTATEVNNYGFELERRLLSREPGQSSAAEQWKLLGFTEGGGTSNVPRDYSFVDRIPGNGLYEYRLRQIDRDGRAEYLQSIVVAVRVRPREYQLAQNYPNPFNPSTMLTYSLVSDGQVTLTVTDLLGREVAVLADGWQSSGEHSIRFDASRLTAGLYLYTLRCGGYSATKKMLLLR